MSDIVDDKSEHCIPFILERLELHRQQYEGEAALPPPFFLGLNGVQGAGKTTLVSTLSKTLSNAPHNFGVVVLSIDDLYLPHDEQEALAKSNPENPLVQHRGVPATHDIGTGLKLFEALANRREDIKIPSYDKSQFNGSGDRRLESEWETVNKKGDLPVAVVVFEGWCVGFEALDDAQVERRWEEARAEVAKNDGKYQGRLGHTKLENVMFVNSRLRGYHGLTVQFSAFVHIDAEDITYVYHWREEQEAAMRREKGSGMSKEQVVNFVNGYYPCYELYTDVLRRGIYGTREGRQLRLIVGRDRKVKEVQRI